jgi:hypothetical protein
MVSKLDAIYVIGFMEKGAINIGEIKWFGDKNNGRMFMNAQKGVHETCIQQIFINELLVVVSVNTIIVECYTSNIFQFLFKWLFVNFPLKLAKKEFILIENVKLMLVLYSRNICFSKSVTLRSSKWYGTWKDY